MLDITKNRRRPTTYVDMVSPHGAHVTVTEERAVALLSRGAIAFGDGTFRKWARADDTDDGKPVEVPVDESAPGLIPDAKQRVAAKRDTGKGE